MTNKTKIRVVFAKNPPDAFSNCPNFPNLEPSWGCPFPGSTSEILSMLMDYLNYDIEPIIVDNQTNDTWKGVLGYLENGTADTACLIYQLTATRGQYFSPSYPTYNDFGAFLRHIDYGHG
uniref:Uncharacterized protein n=1 Tax=Acrobeloides nanus TaxID=290746 RepID=A0A914DJJ4_9BILA